MIDERMRVQDETQVHLNVTEAGRVLLQGMACVLLAALIVPAFGILAALATVILTAFVAGFIMRPRIRLKSNVPESVIVGQTLRLGYQVENAARVSAYQLSVEIDSLPASFERLDASQLIHRLAPGDTADVVLSFKAHRRGRFLIPAPMCRSSFPFNMFVFGISREARQPLLVLPPVFPLRLPLHDRASCMNSSGSGLAGRTEVSPEYAGNRPFVAGDSPRRIDVRAWARLSVPATKEYYTDQDKLAVLILDSRLRELPRSQSDPSEPFEAAVCLCASAALALDRDYSIDAVLIGSTLHRFSQMPGTDRFNSIHQILATVEPSNDCDPESLGAELEERWRDISEVVFILMSSDGMYSRLIDQAVGAGCHATVLLVGAPPTPNSAFARPGDAMRRSSEKPLQADYELAVLSPRDVLEGRMGDL
jgi:uncharacterized protein (DUF58 family)